MIKNSRIRFQQEQNERMAEQSARYAKFESLIVSVMSKLEMPTIDDDDPDAMQKVMDEMFRVLKMGEHFEVILKEIKRQPSVQAHWEELCMLLRLAEDDESQKYYAF